MEPRRQEKLSIQKLAATVVSYIEQMAALYARADFRAGEKPDFSGYLESFLKGQAGSDRIFYNVLTQATPGSLGDQFSFQFSGFVLTQDEKNFIVQLIYGANLSNDNELAKNEAKKIWTFLSKQLMATISTTSDFKNKVDSLLAGSEHKAKIIQYVCQQAIFRVICDDAVRDLVFLLKEAAKKSRAECKQESGKPIFARRSRRISGLNLEVERSEQDSLRFNAVSAHIRRVMLKEQPKIEASVTLTSTTSTVLSGLRRASKSSSRRKKTTKKKNSQKSNSQKSQEHSRSSRGASEGSSRGVSAAPSKHGSRIQRSKTPTLVLELLTDPGDERATREEPVIRQPSPSLLQPPSSSKGSLIRRG